MKLDHNVKPEVVCMMDVTMPQEYCFTMYTPIKMTGDYDVRIPPQFDPYRNICLAALRYEIVGKSVEEMASHYMYLTVKHLFVTPGNPANRPGWHSDGFLTDDINYVWFDKYPTVFCVQPFDVDDDHVRSLVQFEEQAREKNFWTAPEKNFAAVGRKTYSQGTFRHS